MSSTSPVPKTLMSTYTACKYKSYHNLVLPVCFLAVLHWKLKYGFEGLASQQVLVYDRASLPLYLTSFQLLEYQWSEGKFDKQTSSNLTRRFRQFYD